MSARMGADKVASGADEIASGADEIASESDQLTMRVTCARRCESMALAEESLADEHTWFYDRRSVEPMDVLHYYNMFGG